MSSPIERTSAADLNGAAHRVLLPGQRVSSGPVYPQVKPRRRAGSGYSWAELAERADVSIPTLRHWLLSGHFRPVGADRAGLRVPAPGSAPGTVHAAAGATVPSATAASASAASAAVTGASGAADFAAVDVVRLAALARAVRSGVPLARAAALVRDPG
jgi:hypothetical protein